MQLDRDVPLSTMERIPSYLRVIDSLLAHGMAAATSDVLAVRAGVTPVQFRKDMSLVGASSGVRGSGYSLSALRLELREAMGSSERVGFVIVGFGNLGRALASSAAFSRGGLDLLGMFDVSQAAVGQQVGGVQVLHDEMLESFVRLNSVSIAVIATPAEAAQGAADQAILGGVREILNFSPAALQVPESVEVRTIDLGAELQMLALHARTKRRPVVPVDL